MIALDSLHHHDFIFLCGMGAGACAVAWSLWDAVRAVREGSPDE